MLLQEISKLFLNNKELLGDFYNQSSLKDIIQKL